MRPSRATPPRWFLGTGRAARTCHVVPPLRLNCQWFVVVASPAGRGVRPAEVVQEPVERDERAAAPSGRKGWHRGVRVRHRVVLPHRRGGVVLSRAVRLDGIAGDVDFVPTAVTPAWESPTGRSAILGPRVGPGIVVVRPCSRREHLRGLIEIPAEEIELPVDHRAEGLVSTGGLWATVDQFTAVNVSVAWPTVTFVWTGADSLPAVSTVVTR